MSQRKITRVHRSKRDAQDWYNRLSNWYGTLFAPLEADQREAGLDLLDPGAGERILDAGSGTGEALVSLAAAVGPTGRVVGVDFATGMCRTARANVETAAIDDRVEVVCGDATALPLRDDSMDAIFSCFTLELFDTPEIPVALREWRRVLEPEGRLCVVSLSKRRGTLPTRLYERLHTWVPQYLDCRPIFVRETLREAGFRVQHAVDDELWGLAVEIVLARSPGDRC